MKVVDEVRKEIHFQKSFLVSWDNFVDSMPKENESAAEYIASNPERFFIPFETNFKSLQQTLIEGPRRARPLNNAIASLRAPPVVNADSVRRRDNKKPQPSRIDAVTGEDATVRWRLVVLLLPSA